MHAGQAHVVQVHVEKVHVGKLLLLIEAGSFVTQAGSSPTSSPLQHCVCVEILPCFAGFALYGLRNRSLRTRLHGG